MHRGLQRCHLLRERLGISMALLGILLQLRGSPDRPPGSLGLAAVPDGFPTRMITEDSASISVLTVAAEPGGEPAAARECCGAATDRNEGLAATRWPGLCRGGGSRGRWIVRCKQRYRQRKTDAQRSGWLLLLRPLRGRWRPPPRAARAAASCPRPAAALAPPAPAARGPQPARQGGEGKASPKGPKARQDRCSELPSPRAYLPLKSYLFGSIHDRLAPHLVQLGLNRAKRECWRFRRIGSEGPDPHRLVCPMG